MNWYSIPGNSTTPAGLRGTDADAMNGNAVMFDAVAGQIFTTGGSPIYSNGVRNLLPGASSPFPSLGPVSRTTYSLCLTRIGEIRPRPVLFDALRVLSWPASHCCRVWHSHLASS